VGADVVAVSKALLEDKLKRRFLVGALAVINSTKFISLV